jgi:hypothetical protein
MSVCFWFIHVPRTGGTDLAHSARSWQHVNFFCNGHSGYDPALHERLKCEHDRVLLTTALRDPVEHTRSLYAYTKHGGHHLANYSADKSLMQWMRGYPERLIDYFTWFFDRDYAYLPHALATLRKFDRIFDTAHLTDQVNAFLQELNEPSRIQTPASPYPKGALTAPDIQYIKAIRQQDYRLLARIPLCEFRLLH